MQLKCPYVDAGITNQDNWDDQFWAIDKVEAQEQKLTLKRKPKTAFCGNFMGSTLFGGRANALSGNSFQTTKKAGVLSI